MANLITPSGKEEHDPIQSMVDALAPVLAEFGHIHAPYVYGEERQRIFGWLESLQNIRQDMVDFVRERSGQ